MYKSLQFALPFVLFQIIPTTRAQLFPPFFGNGGATTTTNAGTPAPTYADVYCSVTRSDGTTNPSNQGLEYAYYDYNPFFNSVTVSNGTNGYPNYDPAFWDTQVPFYTGQTAYIGFDKIDDTTGQYKYYADSPPHTIPNTTLIHRGYLYARTTGTYTFANSYIDDIVLTWIGQESTQRYTRSNADLVDTYSTPPQNTRAFTVELQAGTYLPFRIQYTNAEQSAALTYSILDPEGFVLLGETASSDIVTQPCSNAATVSATFTPFFEGQYTTQTLAETGGGTVVRTTTIATASGGSTGTIDVFVPQYTATGTPSCAIPTPTLTSDGDGNSGLQYGYWNYSGYDPSGSVPSNYDPGYFDLTAAVHLGVTNRCGCTLGGVSPIYSDTNQVFGSEGFTLTQRGYLYCRVSGYYTFNIPSCKSGDYAAIWLGDTAVSGFQQSNANCHSTGGASTDLTTYRQYCNAGQYLPTRIQYAHGDGVANFGTTITDPNGDQLLNATSAKQIFFQSCPGETSNDANSTDGSNPTGTGSQNPIPTFLRWFANSTSYSTVTSQNPGTETSTIYSTISPSGTTPGTVEVLTPGSYVTITGPYSGTDSISGPVTSVIAAPAGTTPGTIEVFVPASYTTTTAYYTGLDVLAGPSTTTIALPSGTNAGTVEVLLPASYATVTSANSDYANPNPSTTTIALASGTVAGTVEILTPAPYSTITVPYSGNDTLPGPLTTTLAYPSGNNPGTVEVIVPAVYSTTTEAYMGTDVFYGVTITAVQPSGTNPGVVVVITPTTTRSLTSSRPTLATMLGPASCLCLPA